ncbi:hypothetical protein R1flu_011018 [Riccia fluitans]|uniref:Catalase core domain-containing protein n=1 Tax=Riccia fluitans TaxID=41844 RepID=A0ABD1Z6M4_9MARC
MVLNKNIDNNFAENEQVAFCPVLIVPGIYYSDDKMFQTRIFSYVDTQRHRLGPNYLMLPVSAPKCKYHNNHHEGFMNFMHREEEVNYFPSRYYLTHQAEKTLVTEHVLTRKREKAVIYKETTSSSWEIDTGASTLQGIMLHFEYYRSNEVYLAKEGLRSSKYEQKYTEQEVVP